MREEEAGCDEIVSRFLVKDHDAVGAEVVGFLARDDDAVSFVVLQFLAECSRCEFCRDWSSFRVRKFLDFWELVFAEGRLPW